MTDTEEQFQTCLRDVERKFNAEVGASELTGIVSHRATPEEMRDWAINNNCDQLVNAFYAYNGGYMRWETALQIAVIALANENKSYFNELIQYKQKYG